MKLYNVMFRTFINAIVLFTLLLTNMALFTWCVNHLELDKYPIEKTLISNVQAEGATAAVPPPTMVSVMRENMTLSKSVWSHSKSLEPAVSSKKSNYRVFVKFKPGNLQIEQAELAKLQVALQRLHIVPAHAVEILAGGPMVLSENNLISPQISKLRAQNVARVIYPYTQMVKMIYRPNLEEGVVIVDFFQPQAK